MNCNLTATSQKVILGIDPGTVITGYGLIKLEGALYKAIDYGCIRPPPKDILSNRYLFIFNGIEELIKKYGPDVIVVESQFVGKNPQSMMKLNMVIGAIVIAAKRHKLPVYRYPPKSVKKAVGNGQASKGEVQVMVQKILNLACLPTPEDAADALALAICHAHCADYLHEDYEF